MVYLYIHYLDRPKYIKLYMQKYFYTLIYMTDTQLNSILKTSVYSSLFVQILIGIIDLYVYFLPVSGELAIIKKMLGLELFVQLIEGSFYVWFISIFSHVKNVTHNRYYDWVITTPTMLFTFCLYLDFLRERESKKEHMESLLESNESNESNESAKSTTHSLLLQDITLTDYLKTNIGLFLPIFLLNWVMLLLGYLGEIGELNNNMAVLLGFLPFLTFFAIIYVNFAKQSTTTGKILYWAFFGIWSLYGVAAMFSYYWKNISYNILDLFAKNFFGILLAYTLYSNIV